MDSNPQHQQEQQNKINLEAFDLLNNQEQQQVQTNSDNVQNNVQNSFNVTESQQKQTNQNQQEVTQDKQNTQNLDNIRQTANDVCQEIIQKVITSTQQQDQNQNDNTNENVQESQQQQTNDPQGNVQEPMQEQKNEFVNKNNNNSQTQQVFDEQNQNQNEQQSNENEQQNQKNQDETQQNNEQNENDNMDSQKQSQQELKSNQEQQNPQVENIENNDQKQDSQNEQNQNKNEDIQQIQMKETNQKQEVDISVQQQETDQVQDENMDQNQEQQNVQNIELQNLQPYMLQKNEFTNLLKNNQTVLGQKLNSLDNFENQIKSIAQGKNHMLLLTKSGQVFSKGSNEFGQSGTDHNSQFFQKVSLDDNVDLLDAGENFSFAANSNSGVCYIWGKLQSNNKTLCQFNSVKKLVNKKLLKDQIQDIKCGDNHILILSKSKIYVFGDNDYGALGNVFRKDINRCDFENLTTVNLKNVQRIFAFGNQSFAVTKRTKKSKNKESIYCFGSNNYQQLGFESELKNKDVERLPFQWTEIHGDQIEDIQGTNEYTMVLYKNGLVYASGQNDKNQMGQIDKEREPFGTFEFVKNIPFKVSKLKCLNNLNFARSKNGDQIFIWGTLIENLKKENENLNQQNFYQTRVSDMSMNEDNVLILAQNNQEEQSPNKKRDYTGHELNNTNKTRIQQQLI